MLKYCCFLLISFILVLGVSHAQSMGVGIGTNDVPTYRGSGGAATACTLNLEGDHEVDCNAVLIQIIGI